MTFMPCKTRAADNNPALAATIVGMSLVQQKALESMKVELELVTAGHVAVGHEIHTNNEFQREFNRYLDSFQGVIETAAELFGIYYEIKYTIKLTGEITTTLTNAPTNAIAVALSPDKSSIYKSLFNTTLEVANDIYKAAIAKQKLTEQDRNAILCKIRTKIMKVNDTMASLVMFLKCTTMESVWNKLLIKRKFIDKTGRSAIIERCMETWKSNVPKPY